MSIHGGQPIPCWRQDQCAEAWEGKNYCDLNLQQCTQKSNQPKSVQVAPSADNDWQHAADRMWKDLLNFGNLGVPGKTDPSILDKLMYVFFGSSYRADISGVLMIAVAVVLFLL